jgi:hypothetical protein
MINLSNRDQAVLSKATAETDLLSWIEIDPPTASTVVRKAILLEIAPSQERKEKTHVLVIGVDRSVTSSVIAPNLIIDLSVEVMITGTDALVTEIMTAVTSSVEIGTITSQENLEVPSLATIVERKATPAVTALSPRKKETCLKCFAITVNKLDIWLVIVPMNALNVHNSPSVSTVPDNKVGTVSVIIIDSLKDNNANHLLVTTVVKKGTCLATAPNLVNLENSPIVERAEITETAEDLPEDNKDHTALMMNDIDN